MPNVSNAAMLSPDELRPGQHLVLLGPGGQTLARPLMLALGPLGRLRGLLGHPPLRPGQGMLLRPCRQVHTFFMGYAIDVVFLDRGGVVLGLAADLAPWRVSPYEAGARCVVELPAGQAAQAALAVGQRLVFRLTDEVSGDNVMENREPDGP
jgi:uncharacterized membrane protein (UPF0127 family)